ncbi:uncharacterized protein LOC118434994 [Folsomia candida]|nr:uncharacterized protein LOC118434994 [Folsomia candida]
MLHPNETYRPNPQDAKTLFTKFLKSKRSESFQIPGRNPLFRGRNDVFFNISQNLSPPKRLLLYGLAGTGKKSIIAEYLYNSEIVDKHNVYWFHADSLSILEREYVSFMETRNCGTKIPHVKSWLESDNSNWVAIYENVLSYASIQHLLPKNNGIVVYTSRSASFPPEFFKINVGLLQLSDCAEFIQNAIILSDVKNTISVPTQAECAQLSKEMGYLPTAIGQALAFICSDNNEVTTVPDFLEFHRKNMEQFDTDGKIMKFAKTNLSPIYATLLGTLYQIKQESELAFRFVKAISYLHCENIPASFIDTFFEGQDEGNTKLKTLKILNSYSILQRSETSDAKFSVSRALQETVTITFYYEFNETVQDIGKILKQYLPRRSNPLKGYGCVLKQGELISHLESIIDHIDNYVSFVQKDSKILTVEQQENLRSVLRRLLKNLKSLKRAYVTLQNREAVKSIANRIELLETTLYGDESRFLGNIQMANGKFILQSASMTRNAPQFEESIFQAIDKFKEAVPLIEAQCNVNSNRFYLADCYSYLGDCYAMLVGRQHFQVSWKGYSDEGRNGAEDRLHLSQTYYFKAIDELQSVLKDHIKVFFLQKISSVFHKMATNSKKFPSSCDQSLKEEVFLVLSIHYDMLQTHITARGVDVDVEKVLKNYRHFQIDLDFLKRLLESWVAKSQNTKKMLCRLHDFYHEHLSDYREQYTLVHNVLDNKSTRNVVTFGKKYIKPDRLTAGSGTEVILKALDDLKSSSPDNQIAIASIHLLLAKSLRKESRIRESLTSLDSALSIYLKQYTGHSTTLATLYTRMAECHVLLNEKPEARQLYEQAYNLWKTFNLLEKKKKIIFSDFLQKYAATIPDEEITLKIQLWEECLAFAEKAEIKNDGGHVGYIKEILGSLYLDKGDFSSAWKMLQEALDIFNKYEVIPKGDASRVACMKKLIKSVEHLKCAKPLSERYSKALTLETTTDNENSVPQQDEEGQGIRKLRRNRKPARIKYKKRREIWMKKIDTTNN